MEVIGKKLHSLHFVTPDDKALAARRYQVFGELLKRFVDGTRWLNAEIMRGVNVERDKDEFNRFVVEPMDKLWLELTPSEKDYWDKVMLAVRIFKGRLV
jgi:hypothetical protein